MEPVRRRRSANYPLEFKHKLAQQACDPAVSVAQLGLQHGLNANMVLRWRRQLRAGLLDQSGLVAVTVTPPPAVGSQSRDGVIEIQMAEAIVRIEGRPDPATFVAVLKGLRG